MKSNLNSSYLFCIVISITTVFFSCTVEQEKKESALMSNSVNPCPSAVNMDSLTYTIREQVRQEERRDLFMRAIPENNPYIPQGGIYKTEYTFAAKTVVYAEPDTNSKVISILPFASKVNLIEGLKGQQLQGDLWMKIINPLESKKYGYIRYENLADYMEKSYNDNYGFLVGEFDTVINGDYHGSVEIRRFRVNQHVILERYRVKYRASGYRFHKVYNSTLKAFDYSSPGSSHLFRYETFRSSCPGGGMYEFIIDDGTQLKQVVAVSYEGEGGYYNLESVYIPMKFENGKILLVENADVQNIFNTQKAELNVFPYSSDYNVPIEKMVVVKYESNGYETADMNEDPEKAKVITKIAVYQWDGKKLSKVH